MVTWWSRTRHKGRGANSTSHHTKAGLTRENSTADHDVSPSDSFSSGFASKGLGVRVPLAPGGDRRRTGGRGTTRSTCGTFRIGTSRRPRSIVTGSAPVRCIWGSSDFVGDRRALRILSGRIPRRSMSSPARWASLGESSSCLTTRPNWKCHRPSSAMGRTRTPSRWCFAAGSPSGLRHWSVVRNTWPRRSPRRWPTWSARFEPVAWRSAPRLCRGGTTCRCAPR